MRLNENTPPKLAKAIRAYASGEISATDVAGTYRELAEEAEARAAAITPDTKENAIAKGEAIGRARGWRACAALMAESTAEITAAA